MTLREITRRPKKALARRSDIDDEPEVQVQRLDTRMGSGLFIGGYSMGLHVSSVAELPLSEERAYYIYILDYYNWDEPISDALHRNVDKISVFCAANDAVMIKGLPDSHFSSEVLSWTGINGQGPNTILPALLITTIHPRYFIEAHNKSPSKEVKDSLIFIKIRDVCKAPGDVILLLEKVFKDISAHKKIKDFSIARELRSGEHSSFVDALILEPNISGVGVDVKKMISWVKYRFSSK